MQIVSIQVHNLIPRGYEVLHEDLLRVGRCINFRDGPELRVETEDQVHTRAGPLDLTCPAIQPLKQAFRSEDAFPSVAMSSRLGSRLLGAVRRSRADSARLLSFLRDGLPVIDIGVDSAPAHDVALF